VRAVLHKKWACLVSISFTSGILMKVVTTEQLHKCTSRIISWQATKVQVSGQLKHILELWASGQTFRPWPLLHLSPLFSQLLGHYKLQGVALSLADIYLHFNPLFDHLIWVVIRSRIKLTFWSNIVTAFYLQHINGNIWDDLWLWLWKPGWSLVTFSFSSR